MEYGPEIKIDGKRPAWLRDDVWCKVAWIDGKIGGPYPADCICGWERTVTAIRLPADHFAYTVFAHNENHGTRFVPWGGRNDAPGDADLMGGALMKSGELRGDVASCRWYHNDNPGDIIGYTRKGASEAVPIDDGYVRVKQMTEEERARLYPHLDGYTLADLGIIREETPTERFKRENPGLSIDELLAKALGDG